MPIVRIFIVLLALASPAFAQDGARNAASAGDAARMFRGYVEGVARKGERPNLTRPEVAALLGRIFDAEALEALPPARAGDMDWLMDWMDAANATYKLFAFYGAKPGMQPDLATLQRNMADYGGQYATAMNFLVRGMAREAVAGELFMASLAPEQRTRIRQEGFMGFRHGAAEFILSTVCAAIQSAGTSANARLVAAAIRDTRDVWANSLLPQDRARMLDQLADLPRWAPDETARTDLAAFTAALRAVN